MIKVYNNGIEFLKDNSLFLDENRYMSTFFYLDSEVYHECTNKNYAIKLEDNDKRILAMKIEPYNLMLYGSSKILKELLTYLDSNNFEYDTILAPTEIGEELINIDNRYYLDLGMDFMEANQYTHDSFDEVIKATIDDLDEIYNLSVALFKACGLDDKVNIDHLRNKIDNFRIIKIDGKIVSMASFSNDTDKSLRISHVYTIDSFRGKGLASKIVNNIKNEILDKGMVATLNVDKKNPISNHIYYNLGFRKVFSQGLYKRRR